MVRDRGSEQCTYNERTHARTHAQGSSICEGSRQLPTERASERAGRYLWNRLGEKKLFIQQSVESSLPPFVEYVTAPKPQQRRYIVSHALARLTQHSSFYPLAKKKESKIGYNIVHTFD